MGGAKKKSLGGTRLMFHVSNRHVFTGSKGFMKRIKYRNFGLIQDPLIPQEGVPASPCLGLFNHEVLLAVHNPAYNRRNYTKAPTEQKVKSTLKCFNRQAQGVTGV